MAFFLGLRPIDFQSQTFWGLITVVQFPRIEVPDVGHKPLTSQGESLDVRFFPIVGHSTGRRWQDYVSTSYTLDVILFFFIGEEFFRPFSEGIISCVALDFCVVGGSEFKIFPHHHVEQTLKFRIIQFSEVVHIKIPLGQVSFFSDFVK